VALRPRLSPGVPLSEADYIECQARLARRASAVKKFSSENSGGIRSVSNPVY
jgi:hypothetical protein